MNRTQTVIQALKNKGITKWTMKKACGVSWNTIHNWARGHTKPKQDKTEILEKMLGAK